MEDAERTFKTTCRDGLYKKEDAKHIRAIFKRMKKDLGKDEYVMYECG